MEFGSRARSRRLHLCIISVCFSFLLFGWTIEIRRIRFIHGVSRCPLHAFPSLASSSVKRNYEFANVRVSYIYRFDKGELFQYSYLHIDIGFGIGDRRSGNTTCVLHFNINIFTLYASHVFFITRAHTCQ